MIKYWTKKDAKSLHFEKWFSMCAKKHVFRGNGRLFVAKNNDTAHIDSWSAVGLMILPHQSQPIRKTLTCSSVTWPLNAELKPITSSTKISKFWGVSTRAWFGKPGAPPECHLASCSQGTAKTCCVWGWLLAKSQENSTHITLAVWFYWDCGTYWEYYSFVRPHFKLGLWNWIVEHHWAQRWISINCCSSWGKDTLTLWWNWRDWGADEAIYMVSTSVSKSQPFDPSIWVRFWPISGPSRERPMFEHKFELKCSSSKNKESSMKC